MVEGRGLRDYRSTYILICGCALGHSVPEDQNFETQLGRPAIYFPTRQDTHFGGQRGTALHGLWQECTASTGWTFMTKTLCIIVVTSQIPVR